MLGKGLAVLLAVLVPCSGSLAGEANCKGRDLFPLLETQAPDAYRAIEAQARGMPFGRGRLFRLSRDGGPSSYVFGSLHLNDPRVTGLSPEFHAALRETKVLALESVEIGAGLVRAIKQNPAAMQAAFLAQKPQRANVLLDAADFSTLKALVVEAGMKASAASEYKPSILALLLDLPSCARASPKHPYADELIAKMARAQGIEIVGLETIIEQVSILNVLSPAVERDVLMATLRQASHAEDIVETTIARYVDGDTGGLLAWMKSPVLIPGVVEAETPPAFLDRLIDQRNRRMVQRILPLLAKGGAFVVVGAAHLPGEDGILRLLDKAGYTIELVN